MGLDISAAKVAARVEGYDPEEDYDPDAIYLYDHPDFPGRMNDLEDGYYKGEWLEPDYYSGYISYRHLRNYITIAVHGVSSETLWRREQKYKGSAFYEMVDFSDCEGTLGPDTVKKLAADFEEHGDVVRAHMKCLDSARWLNLFERLESVFKAAAECDGVLIYG